MPENQENQFGGRGGTDFEKRLMIKNIGSMQDLPMPSPRMMKVITLLKGSVHVPRLARTIERNPALVTQILSISQGSSSVEEAINDLGLHNIKHIVYSATFMSFFPEWESDDWEHAYSTSVLLVNLMKIMNMPSTSKLSLVALLHDFGKLILKKFNARKYKTVLDINEKGTPVFQAEEAVFHITHAVAGGILLKKWGLADDVIAPVLHHHSQAVSRAHIVDTAILQFANWIDEEARNVPSAPPSPILLKISGIDRFRPDYWMERQKLVIESIRKNAGKGKDGERGVEDLVAPLSFSDILKPEPVLIPTKTTTIKRPIKSSDGMDTSSRRFKRPTAETQTLRRPISLKKPSTLETQTLRRPVRSINSELRETSTQRFKRPSLKKK